MIDYSRIQDPVYVTGFISDINSTTDLTILDNLVRNISYAVKYKDIDYEDVAAILEAVRTRTKDIHAYAYGRSLNVRTKSLNMTPVGSNNNHHTAISDSRGIASIIFIVVNIAITTVMYTLLLIAHFIR